MVGFHEQTFGLYTDVLLQKIDPKGRNTSQIFTDEIAIRLEGTIILSAISSY